MNGIIFLLGTLLSMYIASFIFSFFATWESSGVTSIKSLCLDTIELSFKIFGILVLSIISWIIIISPMLIALQWVSHN